MIRVINDLSTAVIAGLAASGWPALRPFVNGTTGRIIITDVHRLDMFLPPRIVMIPVSSKFGPKDMTRGPVKVANNSSGYDAQSKQAIKNPAVASELVTFEVRCWGVADPDEWGAETDPFIQGSFDFEYTQALYHQVIASCDAIMTGCFKVEGGVWERAGKEGHNQRVGREFVFNLTVNVPVLSVTEPPTIDTSTIPGLRFAPSDVAPSVIDSMYGTSGASESAGCEEDAAVPIRNESGEELVAEDGGFITGDVE